MIALEIRADRRSPSVGRTWTKAHCVALSYEEREELFVLIQRGKAPARTPTRAHILPHARNDAYD